MSYIYKITNNINGKIYIGKTLKDNVEKRWKEHLSDYDKERCEKRPLYDAMKKYGIENFQIEAIEECNENILSEREIYWIEYYGSFKNGYNATKGGDGRPYADYDLIFYLWEIGKTLKEIQQITGYAKETISTALTVNNISKEERIKRSHECRQKGCAMLDKDTEEIIKVFSSLQDARNYLKVSKGGHISDVCKGKRKTAYGYKWKYLSSE